jgi:hypothetical protein
MDRRAFILAGIAAAAARPAPLWARSCPGHGQFSGKLELLALDDGRIMKLLRPYRYTDAAGLAWDVPEGIELDGASIPRIFWSVTGGPWDGPYRNASIIHDHYCVTHSRRWEAVHRMFHEAMLANCTDALKANVMFLAVWLAGPRWPDPVTGQAPPPRREVGLVHFLWLASRVKRENPSRAEIEAMAGP